MKLLSLAVATYKHGKKLTCLLDSLIEQHGVLPEQWEAFIIHDGPCSDFDKIAEEYSIFPQLRFLNTPERANQWGHNLRAIGLEMATGKYFGCTNADNQVCYGWLERLFPAMQDDPDLIMWPCSHSYVEFDLFNPELRAGKIDFCNYVMRTQMAKQLGFPWRHFEADGAQIEGFVNNFPAAKVKKLTGVFTTHN